MNMEKIRGESLRGGINAGMISPASRRVVLREVRENCREYRSESRVCVPNLVYRPRYLVAPTHRPLHRFSVTHM